MVDEACIHYLDWNNVSDVITTNNFSYNRWDIWEETVINCLKTKIGVTNLPLSYFIFNNTTPFTMDHSKLIIYNASLTTAILKANIIKVANLLKTIVLYTDDFEWGGRKFTQSKVREVCLDLVIHYNGYTKYELHIYAARHNLSNPFYKNYMTFNFETFSTKMKANFDTMEKYGEVIYEQDKVSAFLENICTTNQKL